MAVTNVGDFFSQIEENFIEITKNAARTAAKQAQKDIKKKADQFISEYYQYPTQYDRLYALYNIVDDYYSESDGGSGIAIQFGVTYDPSKLGQHTSNSWYRQSGASWIPRMHGDFDFDSQNNGMPSSAWIVDKFWSGIHPSGKIGDNSGHKDQMSSDQKMQHFFDGELQGKVNSYLQSAFYSELSKYF